VEWTYFVSRRALLNLNCPDDVAWVWWIDRQGGSGIQTTGINFVQDLPYFAALVAAFQRFDPIDWGMISSLQSAIHAHIPFTRSFTFTFPGTQITIDVMTEDSCYSRYTLTGRATQVFLAGVATKKEVTISTHPITNKPLTEVDMVLKVYWPEEIRPNEADIIESAWDLAISNPWIQGHIPVLIASCDIGHSTAAIREAIGITRGNTHVLRFLLLEQLKALEDAPSIEDSMKGWRDCLRCKLNFGLINCAQLLSGHYALWKGGIKHGDIGTWNLIWNPVTRAGVLVDFDLATI
jgi:hypothetical protein